MKVGRSRFAPSYPISLSWQRLRDGLGIEDHDLVLIEHEAYEYDLMKNGLPYDAAHEEANKLYNYSKALQEYLESGVMRDGVA